MNLPIEYSGTPVPSMRALLTTFPKDECDSPARSTAPSLAFWSQPEQRIILLCETLRVSPPRLLRL